MRSPFRLLLALLAVVLIAAACSDDGDDIPTLDLSSGNLSPDAADVQSESGTDSVASLEFQTLEGEPASVDQYLTGTPAVINFYAAWCPPCRAELPEFEEVSQELAGDVVFLGMSRDENPNDAIDLLTTTGVTFDSGWDPDGDFYSNFNAFTMPVTVFVNSDGSVAELVNGALNADDLRDKISELS